MKKTLKRKIKIMDAKTTPLEIMQETVINFFYGFAGNSIVVFMSKEVDVAVFINFILYYTFLSFIVNRNRYETYFGKFVVLPGAAALGAFTGYKMALWLSSIL
jgi:hypothetical protein